MPANCIRFESEPAQSLGTVTIIQNVYIIDLGNIQGTGPAGLRIMKMENGDGNALYINNGTAMLIPSGFEGADGVYQVIVKAAKHTGEGRVGVYTIEALGNAGVVVDTAANVVPQQKIVETLILASSSENPIRSIKIRGVELAGWEVCFIFE